MVDTRALLSRDAWKAFSPNLHIGDAALFTDITTVQLPSEQNDAAVKLLNREGYLQVTGVKWGLDLKLMAETVRALSRANLLPVFAFVYDEFWLPFLKLHPICSTILGPYMMLPDFWVWNVDPVRGDSGWRPHRDKDHKSLLPDGSAKSLSVWMALSPATPLNGCMYIVPANLDPTYGTPQDKEWRFDYASVRALPAEAGDVFFWNQALLHWGGRTTPRARESRVSMAFEFQRADVQPFNKPLIKPLTVVSFELRLKLIAKQVLQYRHMYRVDPALEEMALKLVA